MKHRWLRLFLAAWMFASTTACTPAGRELFRHVPTVEDALHDMQGLLNARDVEGILARLSPNFFVRRDAALYPLDYDKITYPERVAAFRRLCKRTLESSTPVIQWKVTAHAEDTVQVLWTNDRGEGFPMVLVRFHETYLISDFNNLAHALQNYDYSRDK